jgi:hypothetical protein
MQQDDLLVVIMSVVGIVVLHALCRAVGKRRKGCTRASAEAFAYALVDWGLVAMCFDDVTAALSSPGAAFDGTPSAPAHGVFVGQMAMLVGEQVRRRNWLGAAQLVAFAVAGYALPWGRLLNCAIAAAHALPFAAARALRLLLPPAVAARATALLQCAALAAAGYAAFCAKRAGGGHSAEVPGPLLAAAALLLRLHQTNIKSVPARARVCACAWVRARECAPALCHACPPAAVGS